jgi:OmpA-OmpF porin, OOP family
MKKKLLCCAFLGVFGVNAALAEDFFYDDRWYVSGTLQHNFYDSDRGLKDSMGVGLGFGKFFAPRWSFDAELNYANPQHQGNELLWSQYGLGLTGRYHFRNEDSRWWPYVALGVAAQRHEDEISSITGGRPLERHGTNLGTKLGVGLQGDYSRTSWRFEVAARQDYDDGYSSNSYFNDLTAGLTVLVKLGPEPQRPVPPPPPEPPAPVITCADLDDDGDGVNNCDDRCPNTPPGTIVGPDGCPVPVTIDLRGVNFDFDKATLRPDAVVILNEAIEILKKYPELRVEVAGHTDSTGPENYNQGLSERRAKTVYDYLTSNGISASRLVGPVGYGELRPIDTNDTREGRARNRRTELNVQN